MRVLTEGEYRNIIRDVFGGTIEVGGRFDPPVRTNGLLTAGAFHAGMTPAALEQFNAAGQQIARQVTSGRNRDTFVPCKPLAADAPDDACVAAFVSSVGRLLFRRSLTEDEIAAAVQEAAAATRQLGSFYDGLSAVLTGFLVSPQFLFVTDDVEDDGAGHSRLTAYAIASRVSFLLWDTGPDSELLRAAESGELHNGRQLSLQVDRMLASPRMESGIRALFEDFLQLDGVEQMEKDAEIYPGFNVALAKDAKEQTLRTVVAHVLDRDADYRDLITTRKTFLSGPLGRVNVIPVPRPDGGWIAYEYPPGDQRAGIITQISFTAGNSHVGGSSPTLRGKAIREQFLCQKVPDPPGDVDFSLFNDVSASKKTARDRLTAHATAPACAGCHKLTDPIGLPLEVFDGAGSMRSTDNGAAIDTAGNIDGTPFADVVGLGKALRDNPALPSCFVSRLYSYATGQSASAEQRALLDYFNKVFAEQKFRVRPLLRALATSPAFYAVADMPPSSDAREAAAAHE